MLVESDEVTHENELSSIFEHIMGDYSSLVQVACVTCKISYLEWLKFILVYNESENIWIIMHRILQ